MASDALARPQPDLAEALCPTLQQAPRQVATALLDLETFALELKQGRRVYQPYWDNVYKRTYAGSDCLEETVANICFWDNSVIKSRVRLQRAVRDAIRRTPLAAYSRGADLDRVAARAIEGALAAQVQQCSPRPTNPPRVG